MQRNKLLKHVAYSLLLVILAVPAFAQTPTTGTGVTVAPYRSTNVRSGPSVTFDVIAELGQGQVIEATGRSDAFSNWLQVNLGTQRGWVAYFTVSVNGEVANLPIVEVAVPIATPTEVPLESLSVASSDLYVTAYRRVNVRTGPGTDYAVIDTLQPGQTADIIGSSGDANEWLQIDLGYATGWIAYFVVSINGELADLDTIVLPLLPDETTAILDDTSDGLLNQAIVITRFNTNLREEPVLGSEVIDIVPYETTVQVLERTEDNRWLRVRHRDVVGWLISSLINPGASNIESLPVAQLQEAGVAITVTDEP